MQLGCVQCGLCIDACDGVMEKIGRPKGLIAYDSELQSRAPPGGPARGEAEDRARPRTILYVVLIVGISLFMAYHLAARSSLDVSALHDRNPVYVLLSDGSIRNAYTVRVANKQLEERAFTLSLEGLPGATVDAVGAAVIDADTLEVVVGPAQTRELRVLVTETPTAGTPESRAVTFVLAAPRRLRDRGRPRPLHPAGPLSAGPTTGAQRAMSFPRSARERLRSRRPASDRPQRCWPFWSRSSA